MPSTLSGPGRRAPEDQGASFFQHALLSISFFIFPLRDDHNDICSDTGTFVFVPQPPPDRFLLAFGSIETLFFAYHSFYPQVPCKIGLKKIMYI